MVPFKQNDNIKENTIYIEMLLVPFRLTPTRNSDDSLGQRNKLTTKKVHVQYNVHKIVYLKSFINKSKSIDILIHNMKSNDRSQKFSLSA